MSTFTFGELLRQFRARARMSQRMLADELGMSRNSIISWERGDYLPANREVVLRIGEVLTLSEKDTDRLLFAAAYPVEFQTQQPDSALFTQIEVAKVEHLIVEHLESRNSSTEPRQATRCDYYAHIFRNPDYIDRTKEVEQVRNAIVHDNLSATSVVPEKRNTNPDALYGMGGIGKTVIARALCDDAKVQTAFPDGILWAALGKDPKIIAIMQEWVKALGGTIGDDISSINSLQNVLARLLRDRSCLLILDDVWQQIHAEAFCVGGPYCHILLTTRDADIARELGARVHTVPVMSRDNAVELLEYWSDGLLTQVHSDLKSQIVKRLGNLPLAVKLAGAQLRHLSPDEWLSGFDIRELNATRPKDRHSSLELTLEYSLDDLDEVNRDLYTALAIFKEDEAIPQVSIERLWYGLKGQDVKSTTRLLADLQSRALLEIAPQGTSQAITLHDLLHDLISNKLGDRYTMAHGALLNAYRVTQRGKGWHTIPDDGYLYDHIAYHLYSAEEKEELRELFSNQDWMLARVQQQRYTYDGYLEDLSLAWKDVEGETKKQIEANQDPSAIALCTYYQLIYTSINSMARSYYPELVQQAIEVGLWTSERALSTVAKISDFDQRVRMYAAILKANSLNQEQRGVAQKLALETALSIDNTLGTRIAALVSIAHLLTGVSLENVLKIIPSYSSDEQACILIALSSQLSGKLLERALKMALALEGRELRAEVLSALTPRLPEQQRTQVLAQVLAVGISMEDERAKAALLAVLASQLNGKLLEQALEATLMLGDKKRLTEVLVALAPRLAKDLPEQALKVLQGLDERWMQAEMLVALAPSLIEEQKNHVLAQAFEKTLDLDDDGLRKERLLRALVPQLKGKLLEQALEAALTLQVARAQAEVLIASIPQLTEKQRGQVLSQAFELVLAIQENDVKAEMLIKLSPYLTEELLERALEVAMVLDNEFGWQAQALIALASRLPQKQRDQVLTHVIKAVLTPTPREHARWLLEKLAPQLTGELLEQMLGNARILDDSWEQAVVLADLVSKLEGGQRTQIIVHTLETALTLRNMEQARILAVLIPLIPGVQRKQVLTLALKAVLTIAIGDTELVDGDEFNDRIQILAELAPHLPEELLQKALEMIQCLKREWMQAMFLAALAPRLPEELRAQKLTRALEIALTSGGGWVPVEILTALVPQLFGKQRVDALTQALKLTLAVPYEHIKMRLLASLAPYLEGELVLPVLKEALALDSTNAPLHVEILEILAPRLERGVLEATLEALIATRDKPGRAKALASLVPCLKEEQRELAQKQVFDAIRHPDDNWQRVALLETLAFQLKGDLLSLASKAGLEISNEWRNQPELLIALAPYLTREMLEHAIRTVLSMDDIDEQVSILVELLPFVKEQTSLLRHIRMAILEMLGDFKHRSRPDLLRWIASKNYFAPPMLSAETLGAIASNITEICRRWYWL